LSAPSSTVRWRLRALRRASQLGFLASWLLLFWWTLRQAGAAVRPDLFLLADPLVAALTMGVGQVAVPALMLSLVVVVATAALGRVFCGWVCPLGTVLDGAGRLLAPRGSRLPADAAARRLKYYVLALLLVASLASAQWIWLLDPLALLFRAVATGYWPLAASWLPAGWLPVGYVPPSATFGPGALLLIVVGLTALAPRAYCRYLCPLGALLGLLSRGSVLRRRVRGCDLCGDEERPAGCAAGCRLGALPDGPAQTELHECIRCGSCLAGCGASAVGFSWSWPGVGAAALQLDRRAFLAAGAGGGCLAPLTPVAARGSGPIRPPAVTEERRFVGQCVRCGQCVQACPTTALRLTLLEAGVAGFWTPALDASVGACQAECAACGAVCPTDAIPAFSTHEADRWATKMGTATLELGRCIAWTEATACGKCVEVCPTKALVVEPGGGDGPRRPVAVDYVRCVGCGQCELACRRVVFGRPALETSVRGRGEPTGLRAEPSERYRLREAHRVR